MTVPNLLGSRQPRVSGNDGPAHRARPEHHRAGHRQHAQRRRGQRSLRQTFFPNQDPIGKHFGLDLPEYNTAFEIVGVVRDAKYRDPGGPPQPMFYAPLAQHVTYDQPVMALIDHRTHYIGGAVLAVARKRPGDRSAHP